MEAKMQEFTYFAVTKGFRPEFIPPLTRLIGRLSTSRDQSIRDTIACSWPSKRGWSAFKPTLTLSQSRWRQWASPTPLHQPSQEPFRLHRATLHNSFLAFSGYPQIRVSLHNSHSFALNNSMEDFLARYCYNSSIPSPCFFREEVFVAEGGPIFRFIIVLPGNPVGPGIGAKHRYSLLEFDARDDAAYSMLCILLHHMEREIRDFNYLRARRLQEENDNLRIQIEALQARVEQLESDSDNSLHYYGTP
ncbi:hypothetical protein PIB30_054514 [Stylosanthes scabra]|uniref:Uncharacterized protein n=1 Tax=Stylosanthes scabra TaxID=79078 RepID=A0ABU6UI99_9FABA|nr:hypothetical protein [Stylosanthes scabra]